MLFLLHIKFNLALSVNVEICVFIFYYIVLVCNNIQLYTSQLS